MSEPKSLIPADQGFADRVRESFARQAVMATLGAHLDRIEPGQAEISFPFRRDLTQQHGFIHAGVLATVLDSACGYAAYSLMPADAAVLSVEFRIHLLAPANGERFVARARVIRAGRNLTVTQSDGYAVRDGREHHVATMTGTMMCVRDRPTLVG
jgi:uncharacterized protein (TIGR00369 family)